MATAKKTETTEAATEAPEAVKVESRQTKRNRLRGQAERHIIEQHRKEYEDYAEKLFAANGETFQRRLSDEEKAEKQLKELLEANPGLAARFGVPLEAEGNTETTDDAS